MSIFFLHCSHLVNLVFFLFLFFFFFNDTPTTEIYTLSLHDALPIRSIVAGPIAVSPLARPSLRACAARSEEHTSEVQSPVHLVCRLLLEKKKKKGGGFCQRNIKLKIEEPDELMDVG